jgi:ADP-heptose:LPS heptosyltransferase
MIRKNQNLAKSYAIFVRSSYGDLLMTDPLIKYIKSLNTNNKITLFVEEKNVQLVEFMENIDYFYTIPSKGNKYLFFIFYGLRYRKNKYDISIAAKTGVGSANGFFQFMLGAKKQISYVAKNRTWTDRLINCPILFNNEIYQSQHYALGVLQLIDHNLKKIPNALYPRLKIKLNPNNNLKLKLLISVSNNRESCRLEIDRIATILNKLSEDFDFEIFISALDIDYDKASKLKNQINQHSTIKITPQLKDFISLIKGVDICFLGEGGIMHIAAALDIHQVVLFGYTSSITWSPLSKNAVVLSDRINVNKIPKNDIYYALRMKMRNITNSRK